MFNTREFIVHVDKIVQLVNETRLNNRHAYDIQEILQVTVGGNILNNDLKELEEQQMYENYEINVSKLVSTI